MDKIKRYAAIQNMFEMSRSLIEKINNPKILLEKLESFKEEGMKYFKEGNKDAFQYTNRLYQVTFDHAKKKGANLSNYQESLEAYLN